MISPEVLIYLEYKTLHKITILALCKQFTLECSDNNASRLNGISSLCVKRDH